MNETKTKGIVVKEINNLYNIYKSDNHFNIEI